MLVCIVTYKYSIFKLYEILVINVTYIMDKNDVLNN